MIASLNFQTLIRECPADLEILFFLTMIYLEDVAIHILQILGVPGWIGVTPSSKFLYDVQ